jgi:transcriptional regulator with XRE-family HTH domain
MATWLPKGLIGKKIREVRKLRDLTQEGLATEIGIPGSQSEVSKWEKGDLMPPEDRLEAIAGLIGLDARWFQAREKNEDYKAGLRVGASILRNALEQLEAEINQEEPAPSQAQKKAASPPVGATVGSEGLDLDSVARTDEQLAQPEIQKALTGRKPRPMAPKPKKAAGAEPPVRRRADRGR